MGNPYSNAWVRLRQVREVMQYYLDLELGQYGLTLAQLDILQMLSVSAEPLSPGQISSYCFREPQSISELVTRMVNAGYLEKVRDPDNQRSVRVRLLPKGEALRMKAIGSGFCYGYQVLRSAFSEEEIEVFDRLLTRVRDTVADELGLFVQPLPSNLDARALARLR